MTVAAADSSKGTKKKKKKAAAADRPKTPVSPSVSHPKNRVTANKDRKSAAKHQRSLSADSALPENVSIPFESPTMYIVLSSVV